jgi:hypothetical protein
MNTPHTTIHDNSDPEAKMEALGAVKKERHGNGKVIPLVPDAEHSLPLIQATPFVWRDPRKLPRRQFICGTHWIRKYLSVTVAPGGRGKSALKIAQALQAASGKPLLHDVPDQPYRVWYWNGEDPADETERRIHAAMQFFRLTPEDLGDRLFIDSGRLMPITIAVDERNGMTICQPVIRGVVHTFLDKRIDIGIFDPFVTTHSVGESDNGKINAVSKQWAYIAEETNSAIEVVHHVRKSGSGEQRDYTADDSRGASALVFAGRSAEVLNGMNEADADRCGVPQNQRWAYFRIDDGKKNLAPPADKARWCRLESVILPEDDELGFGDNVGVATFWQWPDISNGITLDITKRVQAAVKAGKWRKDVQTKAAWVGHPIAEVLGLNIDDPKHKDQIKRAIHEWLLSGALKTELRPHPDRPNRDTEFVVVGSEI